MRANDHIMITHSIMTAMMMRLIVVIVTVNMIINKLMMMIPIEVTLVGMITDVNDEHPWKAI